MNLTHEQITALDQGKVVPFVVEGREYIVLSREHYDRVKGVLEGELDADSVYNLIEAVMAEDDAHDPGLESYQKYK
jgi:hypothetical protein